jgi:hypothetical protein
MFSGESAMRMIFALFALSTVAACGVETVGTAATGAAIKKQELEQGQATMQQMQQRIDDMNRQAQQRAEQAGGER